jgi:two-component system phosphate regulon response regulator PhoB
MGTILVVDDDADVRELIAFKLRAAGYPTTTASDGRDGLALALAAPPAAVVLDWTMPHLSGLEVLRCLRADPRTRDVPVLMVTARCQDGDEMICRDAGATDYLTRPFRPRELVSRVRALVPR